MEYVGIIISIAAMFVVFLFRDRDRSVTISKIEARLEQFNETAKKHLDTSSKIVNEIQEISSAQQSLRPDLPLFLSKQWHFIGKTYKHRYEKHSIARTIASNYVQDNMKILLDSGSTTDLVTSELLVSPAKGVHVHSNNVAAAMYLVGTTQVQFYLFPGLFNDRFAAVYSTEANNIIDQHGFDVIILAATALRFDTGIMVHADDDNNYEFKQTALKVFNRSVNIKLIIAADASKFFEPIDKHKGIVSQDEWQKIINKNSSRIVLVTSHPAPDFDDNQVFTTQEEIKKFKNIGIYVDEA